ncbi:MAG: prepilin-type N-terminal cleavage/methylation domain-containing protein [Planctomycetota bacterium]|nr:prepilin-type N-terminal cleavage/methylation domain-containing protein [Planctomycetota bacterium]
MLRLSVRAGRPAMWYVRGGFTLVEVLLASAILATTAVAVTNAIMAGQMLTYEALHNHQATALAEALTEEILALPYNDPDGDVIAGPDAGESGRSDFDAADDFHGFSEAAAALADAQGTLLPDAHQLFSRSATAVYESRTVTGFSAAIPGLTIQVTVQDQRGTTWTLTRFITEPPP